MGLPNGEAHSRNNKLPRVTVWSLSAVNYNMESMRNFCYPLFCLKISNAITVAAEAAEREPRNDRP